MADQNSSSNLNPQDASSPQPAQPVPTTAAKPTAAKPPAARRRHRLFKAVVILIIGVVIFIAILPTLLSMGWARHIAENKANEKLRGRLAIGDWSLGWFSGARLGSVNLVDSEGKPVFQLAGLETHLSLTDVLRGNFDLGKVPVSGMRLYITREPDGTLNLQKLLPVKAAPPTPPQHPAVPQPAAPQPAAPSKLPDISVDLELSDSQATFTDATTGRSVTFPITGSIKIPNINQPIANDIHIGFQPGPGSAESSAIPAPGMISLTGSISAIHNNQLDANQPDVDETLQLSGDFASLQPMLARDFTALSGQSSGQFKLRLKPHESGSVSGQMKIADVRAAGSATKGDTFAADAITVAVVPTALPTAGGLDALATTSDRLITGSNVAGGSPILISLEQGKSKSSLSVDINTAMCALSNLAKRQAPGSDGKIQIIADGDCASLANQLPHLFHIRPGVTIESGTVHADTGIAMTATDSTPSLSFGMLNVVGAKAGKRIALQPITTSASFTMHDGGAMPKLQDLKAQFASEFGTGSFTAPTPSQINGQCTGDLANAQAQIGQLIDFGSTTISGKIVGNISSANADADSTGQSATVHGNLTVTTFRADRGGKPPIDVPSVQYTLAATMIHDSAHAVSKVTGFDLTGTVGATDRPAVVTHFSTDLEFGPHFSIAATNLNSTNSIIVTELRRELGTAPTEKIPADYTLKAAIAGSVSTSQAGCSVNLHTFAITDNHGLIAIQRAGDKDIHFATGASRAQTAASGLVSVAADLGAFDAIIATDSGEKAHLATGHLDGWMALFGDASASHFQEDLKASGITVQAGKRKTAVSDVDLQTFATFGPGDEMQLSNFTLTGAGANIHLKQPMVVSSSESGQMAINAELVGTGDVGQAMALYYAVKSAAPVGIFSGSYTLDQSFSTSSGVISAKGTIQGNFAIATNAKPTFSEPNFSIADEASIDQEHRSLVLTNASIDLHGSGALRLAARGTIDDYIGERTLRGVSADLHYDAGALWKLIYATCTPQQQKEYKDVKLAGVVDRQFTIAGSYPAGRPFDETVRQLIMQGGIAIPSFEGKGMSIANLDLPLSLRGGIFQISQPSPATMNGGHLNLAGVAVDLADAHERLSIPANTHLFDNVSLNPVFVQNASGWVNNPLFVGTDQAAGVLNVIIDNCDRLPADDLVKSAGPDNDGTFHMHMTLGRVQIGAPMLTEVSKGFGSLLGQKLAAPSLQGEISNYTLDLAKGIMTTDMTMDLTAKKRPLKLTGTVVLASEKLDMLLDVPTTLFGGDKSPLIQVAGDNLNIPITGTVNHPKFDVKDLVKKEILKNPGKDLGNLLKGIGG